MTNNPHVVTVTTTTVTTKTIPIIRTGQIWRDGKHSNPNRLLLVLDASQPKVICRSLQSGAIRKVCKEQFGRGEQGFHYAAEIHDVCNKFNSYQKTRATQN
jgi:hypothetical protein